MLQDKRPATFVLAVACGLGTAAAEPPETMIDIVATYSIDADTFELVRYSFDTDDFRVIGVVQTESEETIVDCENLAFVPHGMTKGIYAVPTKNPFKGRLVKIDPLTATAAPFLPVVVPSGNDDDDGEWEDGGGARKVTGMTPYFDDVDEQWYLLAASSEDRKSDPDRIESRVLIRIDPGSGTSSIVATKHMLGDGIRFESLGFDANGDLFATSRKHFLRIHQDDGYWVEDLGPTGLNKAEAFEVALGDRQAGITIPGINPSWTQNGVFFAACENTQMFGVINPATGQFQEYLVEGGLKSAFVMKDAEGLVFVTLSSDPLYGSMFGFD
jgi:hypothetical protein